MAIHLIVVDPNGEPIGDNKEEVFGYLSHIRDLSGQELNGPVMAQEVKDLYSDLSVKHFKVLDEARDLPYVTLFIKKIKEDDLAEKGIIRGQISFFVKRLVGIATNDSFEGQMQHWLTKEGNTIMYLTVPVAPIDDMFSRGARNKIRGV